MPSDPSTSSSNTDMISSTSSTKNSYSRPSGLDTINVNSEHARRTYVMLPMFQSMSEKNFLSGFRKESRRLMSLVLSASLSMAVLFSNGPSISDRATWKSQALYSLV